MPGLSLHPTPKGSFTSIFAYFIVFLLLPGNSKAESGCHGVRNCMHFSADIVTPLEEYPSIRHSSSIAGCQDICQADNKRYYKFKPESSSGPAQCSCFNSCINLAAGISTVGSVEACNPGWTWNSQGGDSATQQTSRRSERAKRYGPCTVKFKTCPPRCPGKSICLKDGTTASCCCVGLTPIPHIHGGKLIDCKPE